MGIYEMPIVYQIISMTVLIEEAIRQLILPSAYFTHSSPQKFFSDETKKLKQDLQGPSENNDWKAQCLSLQDQIGKKIAFKR